jgi:FKBP-type peptidyl-prolyl cis-trans isomerase
MQFSQKLILILLILALGCKKGEVKIMANGLISEEIIIGSGSEAQDYNKVVVEYIGELEDGTIFDSSSKPGGGPYTFTLGVGSVIKGWDLGIKGMKVGGKRKLIVPSELGYGNQDMGVIPPNSKLIFIVELMEVEVY